MNVQHYQQLLLDLEKILSERTDRQSTAPVMKPFYMRKKRTSLCYTQCMPVFDRQKSSLVPNGSATPASAGKPIRRAKGI